MGLEKIRDIPDYIRPYFDEASQFQHYYEHEKISQFSRDIDEQFVCLKGFSSSTPMFNSASFGRECFGGGLYFRYAGHGIAVDPGIGFTSLMHRNNIFIRDIDIVIVTHSHLDHNCDVAALSALRHDYNQNKNRERSFFTSFFECNQDEPHKITWYMDEETIRSSEDLLNDDVVYALSECCDGHAIKLNENIELQAIRTSHIKGCGNTYGIKLCFGLGSTVHIWGYTSDTRFFDALGRFFQGVQTLVFNISDIYPSDVEGRKAKRSHLGFDGSIKLLDAVKPPIAIASEFCCTNGDYRYEIVKALQEYSGMRVLPSDPGLMIGIVDNAVRCSLCKKMVAVDCVKVAHPEKEYGSIQYICPDCLL